MQLSLVNVRRLISRTRNRPGVDSRVQAPALPRSLANRLEHATDAAEKLNVSGCGAASHFIQPSNGRRLQARLGRALRGIHHVDFDFNGVFSPLHPALAFFVSLVHEENHSGKQTATSIARPLSVNHAQTASTSAPSASSSRTTIDG